MTDQPGDASAERVRHHLAAAERAVAEGRPAQAETSLLAALSVDPDHVQATRLLATLEARSGRGGAARARLEALLPRRPHSAPLLNTLGLVLLQTGAPRAEAEARFAQAAALDPGLVDAATNLANLRLERGDAASALAALATLRGTGRLPSPAFALVLGRTLSELGAWEEATPPLEEALRRLPDQPLALHALGRARLALGNPTGAGDLLERAVRVAPRLFQGWFDLGRARLGIGRPDAAAEAMLQAASLRPEAPEPKLMAATALMTTGRFREAEGALTGVAAAAGPGRIALARGLVRLAAGHLASAEADFASAARDPHARPGALRGALLVRHFDDRPAVEDLLTLARAYWAERDMATAPRLDPRPAGTRRLRVGFVSGGLAQHPAGRFVAPLLERLDRNRFEPVLVPTFARDDIVARRLKPLAERWAPAPSAAAEPLARHLAALDLDIAIEMNGWTARGELDAFALWPVPVQLKWVGAQMATTGLPTLAGFIGDPVGTPPELAPFFTEPLLRMPHDYLAFEPPLGAPEPGPPPLLARRRVTFGSYNAPSKLTPGCLALWARVLLAVPGSCLLLRYRGLDDPDVSARILAGLQGAGLERDRIAIRGGCTQAEMLAAWREVDIALDPSPYSGGLTTCEALWMGVPTVTWPRRRFCSRHAATHLTAAGLADWVVDGPEAYVARAALAASDPEGLAVLRRGLRERLLASPLCDLAGHARAFGALLEGAWGRLGV